MSPGAEPPVDQAQKMEAIGQLAGGVAHDFNNLLTVITGRSALTLSALPADHPHRRNLELIETTAQRAAAASRRNVRETSTKWGAAIPLQTPYRDLDRPLTF